MAAAVADNVVAMSDSITTTGIQQIEIAIPEIRRIFVATFATIVIVFLWILQKELRKRYGETPEANLADRVGGMLALPASTDSPPEIADPAPELRPTVVDYTADRALPPMPWLSRRALDAMGPPDRQQSALTLVGRQNGVKFNARWHGVNGEYLWIVESISQKKGSKYYTVKLKIRGTDPDRTYYPDSKEILSCDCAGFREIEKEVQQDGNLLALLCGRFDCRRSARSLSRRNGPFRCAAATVRGGHRGPERGNKSTGME